MIFRAVAATAALCCLTCHPAVAASTLTTECQKNLSDGRVLVVDGRVLADNARFKVLSYHAARTESGWSYGPCVLRVTVGD